MFVGLKGKRKFKKYKTRSGNMILSLCPTLSGCGMKRERIFDCRWKRGGGFGLERVFRGIKMELRCWIIKILRRSEMLPFQAGTAGNTESVPLFIPTVGVFGEMQTLKYPSHNNKGAQRQSGLHCFFDILTILQTKIQTNFQTNFQTSNEPLTDSPNAGKQCFLSCS